MFDLSNGPVVVISLADLNKHIDSAKECKEECAALKTEIDGLKTFSVKKLEIAFAKLLKLAEVHYNHKFLDAANAFLRNSGIWVSTIQSLHGTEYHISYDPTKFPNILDERDHCTP